MNIYIKIFILLIIALIISLIIFFKTLYSRLIGERLEAKKLARIEKMKEEYLRKK